MKLNQQKWNLLLRKDMIFLAMFKFDINSTLNLLAIVQKRKDKIVRYAKNF